MITKQKLELALIRIFFVLLELLLNLKWNLECKKQQVVII